MSDFIKQGLSYVTLQCFVSNHRIWFLREKILKYSNGIIESKTICTIFIHSSFLLFELIETFTQQNANLSQKENFHDSAHLTKYWFILMSREDWMIYKQVLSLNPWASYLQSNLQIKLRTPSLVSENALSVWSVMNKCQT